MAETLAEQAADIIGRLSDLANHLHQYEQVTRDLDRQNQELRAEIALLHEQLTAVHDLRDE